MKKLSVALLGTGTMGGGMAANLLKAGFPLAVYNRTRARAERFAAQGARIADTPAAAAKGAHLVLSMLSHDEACREAWTGSQGALAAAEPGAVLVECSTASPAWIVELSALAKARGLELLDAPVTGSRAQAEGGQLTFLVGGPEEELARVRAPLEAMSKEIIHLGPITSGAKMKLLNNFLCGVQVASLAEGMVWLEHSGLDRDKALQVLKSGAPGSPLISAISARMVSQDYSVNFLLRLLSKDLAYAHAAAEQNGVNLSSAANAQELFDRAAVAGYGEKDISAVVEVLRHPGHPKP
jgi:3-hydroxyisobutyrate dehydrogenase